MHNRKPIHGKRLLITLGVSLLLMLALAVTAFATDGELVSFGAPLIRYRED